MYKKNYKGKCYKRALMKCEETCRIYSEIADVYAQSLEENQWGFDGTKVCYETSSCKAYDNKTLDSFKAVLA